MWGVPLSRRVSIKETLNLQGFINFNVVVSTSQIFKQIGNSISINVLTNLFQNMF